MTEQIKYTMNCYQSDAQLCSEILYDMGYRKVSEDSASGKIDTDKLISFFKTCKDKYGNKHLTWNQLIHVVKLASGEERYNNVDTTK